MKNLFCRFLAAWFISSLMAPIGVTEEVIRITNGDWPPFYSTEPPDYGMDSLIVTESFASQGVRVIYGFFPWKRAYELSRMGRWDGAVGWPKASGREQFHLYSEQPLNQGRWVVFHLKGHSFDWGNPDKLKGLKFGVTLGGWALDGESRLTTAMRENKLYYETVPRDELNFLKLKAGRIDAFPHQLEVGIEQLKQLIGKGKLTTREASQITYNPHPFGRLPLYLLLSNRVEGNKRMMTLFDKGFRQLVDSGRFAEIRRQYGYQD